MAPVRPQAGREIELKFLCSPQDGERALAAAPQGHEEPRELISVYFDTPEGDLRKAGVSLRVRESNGRRVQTLKRGDGLSREEYELALVSGTPNLSAPPLVELLSEAQRRSLRPTFGVGVRRRQRLVRYGGAEIEIALDQGKIHGAGRTARISELELELRAGTADALFDLGRELLKAAPLYLSFDGKSTQGDAVVNEGGRKARRKHVPVIAPEHTAGEAFQLIARGALDQIAANATILRRGELGAEAVHQLRVAVRRLRSAMSVFKPVVEDACFAVMRTELKWLGTAGNPARNLDVFLAETVVPAIPLDEEPQVIERLAAALEEARVGVYASLTQALASARFRSLLLEATAWIETGPWLADDTAAAWRLRHRPVQDFAAEVLAKRWKKLGKMGRTLGDLDDIGRHHVRIEAKKLRYAAEAFVPLFPGKAGLELVARVKTLQDELGKLNDVATAQEAIGALPLEPALAFAAGRLAGKRAADKDAQIKRAAKAMKRLRKADRFWRI